MSPRWRRLSAAAGAALFAAATLALFFISRGKWSDAIIDSGREWIVPDALARGQVLYRDVVYWFGPFTPYFHALFFRLFGSSFVTLVAAGAVAAAGVLAALYAALRAVAPRGQAAAWTALAVPALVLMPNAGGALLGMGFRIWHAAAFALAAVVLAGRGVPRRPRWTAVLSGTLAALAGLCRTEWGLAALAAVLCAAAVRRPTRKGLVRDVALTVVSFSTLVAAGLGVFVLEAGPEAVLGDGHVLLTGLPPETREFLVAFSGVRGWRGGLAQLVYSFAMWLGAFLLVDLAALGSRDPGRVRRHAPWLMGLLAVLAASAFMGGASGAVLFSAAPLVCACAAVMGFSRPHGSRSALLAACGLLGLGLSYRRPFHIGDSAYVAPPLLFAFVCAAGLLERAAASVGTAPRRRRLAAALTVSAAALAAIAFGGRILQYSSDSRVSIEGTDGMLSASREDAREIEALSSAVRSATTPGDGLVCFPEGELVNFLSGRPNPSRFKLYIPGYLNDANEAAVLADLSRVRPGAVIVWDRYTSEYGRGAFGVDYGPALKQWIDARYERHAFGGRLGSRVALFLRRGTGPR